VGPKKQRQKRSKEMGQGDKRGQWHGSRNKAMELVKFGIEVPKLDFWSYEELILIYFDVKRCWVLRDIWASCPFSPSPLCSIFLFE
jgi:hypothetical protein